MNRFKPFFFFLALGVACATVSPEPADAAGRGRGKTKITTTTTTTTQAPAAIDPLPDCIDPLPDCIDFAWEPDPPTCVIGSAVIDDELRAAHCERYCNCPGATCIPSDGYGFPNCEWASGSGGGCPD